MAFETFPGQAAVGGLVEAAAGAAAFEVPGLAANLVERRVDDAGVIGVEDDVDGARVLVLVENLLPRLAAVGGAEDAAFRVRAEGVADRRDQHDVRITRVDDDRADLARVLQPDVVPGLAAVGRFIYAVAVGVVAA